jgi:hypothetical protein
VVGREANVSLLLSVRSKSGSSSKSVKNFSVADIGSGPNSPDQSPDLEGLNVVQLLDGLLDLPLVALQVNNEHQSVVLLDLLHGSLGVQGVLDGPELVHPRKVGNGLPWVTRSTSELEGVRSVERDRGSDLADRGRVGTLKGGLLGGLGLDIGGLGRS